MFQVILHFATLVHIANKPSTSTQIHTVRAEDVCSTVPCRLYQEAYIQTGSKQHRASHASEVRMVILCGLSFCPEGKHMLLPACSIWHDMQIRYHAEQSKCSVGGRALRSVGLLFVLDKCIH